MYGGRGRAQRTQSGSHLLGGRSALREGRGQVSRQFGRTLTTRMDLAYRREENEYARIGVGSVTDEVYSLRLRADYQLMRHVSVYGGIEYEDWMSDDDNQEYDRFLGTLGLNFRY